MAKNYFKFGSFNRICDWSGFKVKAGQTRKQWDNWIVRDQDWDPRHPQEFLRGIPDLMAAPDPRPESADVFVGTLNDNTGWFLQEPAGNVFAILKEDGGFILFEFDPYAGPQV